MNPWLQMGQQDSETALRNQIAMQRQGLAQQEQSLPLMANFKSQMDLTPLAGLTDAWTGSNFAKSVQRPESPLERLQAIQQAQGAIQRNKSGLNSDEMALLRMHEQSQDRDEGREMRRILLGQSMGKEAQNTRESFLKSKEAQSVERLAKTRDAFDHYIDRVNTHGFSAFGEEATKTDASYQALLVQLKEAEDLGAITQSDAAIMRGQIPSVTGISAVPFAQSYKGGKDAILSTLKSTRGTLETRAQHNINALDKAFPNSVEATKDQKGRFRQMFPTAAAPAGDDAAKKKALIEQIRAAQRTK